MNPLLNRFLSWYYARAVRERALLTVAAVTVLGALWLELGAARLEKPNKELRDRIEQVQNDRSRLTTELAVAAQMAQPDFAQRAAEERRALQQQVQQLDQTLRGTGALLSSPGETRALLDELLQPQPLRLVSLQRLPTTEERVGDDPDLPVLYRHPLRLTLEGTYPDVQAFLRHLDRTPLANRWQRVHVFSKDYPLLQLEIELSFLSFEPQWLALE